MTCVSRGCREFSYCWWALLPFDGALPCCCRGDSFSLLSWLPVWSRRGFVCLWEKSGQTRNLQHWLKEEWFVFAILPLWNKLFYYSLVLLYLLEVSDRCVFYFRTVQMIEIAFHSTQLKFWCFLLLLSPLNPPKDVLAFVGFTDMNYSCYILSVWWCCYSVLSTYRLIKMSYLGWYAVVALLL